MEDLLEYLLKTETTPDYAFRPRLAPAGYKPKPLSMKKASGRVKKRPRRAARKG